MKQNIAIPEKVSVTYETSYLKVKGEQGEISRIFPLLQIKIENNTIVASIKGEKRRQKRILNTNTAHIKNMIRGAQKLWTYKLKICASHFPLQASVQEEKFQIKNFVGEKKVRQMNLPKNVKVTIQDSDITVESPDIEVAGRVAGRIERLTAIPNKDRRVFQDGIYITEKKG